MQTVWKFPLPKEVTHQFSLEMPKDGLDLSVNFDPKIEQICLWSLVKPENETVIRSFVLAATGQDIIGWNIIRHVGSCSAFEILFYHLFEVE